MDALTQLQDLLRDLFQLDLADLDFGLYRLFRMKRQEVEAFLKEQLPRRVSEAFESAAGEERGALEREISELAGRIRKDIAEDAILMSGEVNPEYREMKAKAARELINTYEAKRRQLQAVQATEAQKAEVFNHLYAFFSRYYEAGDFIPRRRFGARESYAVPYNGEETLFHWANKDQHYVKTTEAFRDYAFSVEAVGGPFRVRFVLTEANLPPGNIKGDTRYFFPLPEQIRWEKDSRTLRVPFHYRLPTEREIDKLGKNSRLQEAILQSALPKILHAIPDDTLRAAVAVAVEQKEDQMISLLLKHLRHFTRRNTTDYFIHKQLDRFLKRELEFYLKDQVMHLGDLEGDLEGKRRTLRVIRQLAEEVITFLAQIEDVQKRLFEKRKFVLQANYLVPVKEVSRDLWKDVLANQAQIEAWKELYGIETRKGNVNERFLKDHPTLVVNTTFFGLDFKERLLSEFDDLDGYTDGLLIHAENYQALRLLERKYASKVKCIYIDPPYNTGSDEFIYKDRYQHSTWLSMMEERISVARSLMRGEGALFVQIGDEEVDNLKKVLYSCLGGENFRNAIVIRRGIKNVQSQFESISALSVGHDIIYVFTRNIETRLPKLYEESKEFQPGKWDTFWRGTDRPTMRYEIFGVNPDRGQWRWSKERALRAKGNYEEYLAKQSDRCTLDDYYLEQINVTGQGPDFVRKSGEGVVQYYVPPRNYKLLSDVWLNVPTRGDFTQFETEKNTALLGRIISWVAPRQDYILDFFAGSGTTGHAVINLNREDGGQRKFMLVEMAHYFDTVLLPRIQKVMYTPEWKDGKPKRPATKEEVERTPRLVKILRLEGYEDALHNLSTDETLKREEPRARAHKERLGDNVYRLSYLIRLPLEASASMLNLAALEHPFDYQIEVLTEDGPKVETIDLVETFNFLYGLHVERLEMWVNDKDKRRYRAVKAKNRDGHSVLVLWRDMKDLDPAAERRFLEGKLKSEGPFDDVLINGDTATPNVKSLDGLFKRLLEEGEK